MSLATAVDFVAVAVFGALVGVGELVSRYRDAGPYQKKVRCWSADWKDLE